MRRRRSFALAPLSLALLSQAGAAPFVPGTEADPPTGELGAPPERAHEPLRGEGIQWVLAPWRSGGTLAVDLRALRLEDGRTTRQGLLLGDVDFASYIWQPWFVQLRFGAGFIAARASGDGLGPGSDNGTLTGRAAISVFPASRFPFELRADVSDSRHGGVALGGDFRSQRLSLMQRYRPEQGNSNFQLQVEQSRLDDGLSRDTLTLLNASALHQSGPHQVDIGLTHSDNQRSDTDEHTRLSVLSARHGYQPSTAMNIETLATWNELRLHANALESGSNVRQLSTFATWRPATKLTGTPSAPLLAASLRGVDSRSLGDTNSRVQAINGTLGLSQELSQAWRMSLSAHANDLHSSTGAGGKSAGAQAAVNWAPLAARWGPWRYMPSAGFNLSGDRDSTGADRQLVGAQASHGLSRDITLGQGRMLGLSFSQSGAVLRESGVESLSRALAHSASLSWQSVDATGSQSFGGVSASDSRSHGLSRGHFQLVNLQLSQRTQITRFSNWAANLTVQASRNASSEVDVFTGERREIGNGWQRYTNGTLSYENQRAFGVPRLRGTVLLGVNSQPLERRALGDIDAPRERITASLEARLDHSIGQLETRLSARVARIDGKDVAALQARAQRRF